MVFIVPLVLFLSCNTRPDINYALATRALEAAREENAAISGCASRNYYIAEREYKTGRRMFTKGDWNGANEKFESARIFAEKAEEEALFCDR
ncbi:MAG: hypothetical protein JXA66_05575 [Oligoflexia bacterium]|nr:hypothetical protein [Oligoflexia bacterium]